MFSNRGKRRVRLLTVISAATILAFSAAGCSAASSAPHEDGKTLKVWWWETKGSALSDAWNKALDIFKKEHPKVKVEFELKTFNQMQKSGQLLLQSNSGPDVLEYNKGNATAGAVAKAGLLTDLTQAAKDDKWAVNNSAQDVGLYNSKGLMGSGKRYGLTNYGEFVGVWYNKKQFKQFGLSTPTTTSQFEHDMQVFVDHGITPLALGSNDYFGVHLMYELALQNMNTKDVSSYQYFTGGVNWAAWTKALTTYQDWVKKGYVAKNSTGVSAQDAGTAFTAGKFPMMVSGTWWAGPLAKQVGSNDVGEFLFPGTKYAPGSGGNIWVVPAKAKNKTLAEDFITITQSPAVQNLLGQEGGVPVAASPSKISSTVGKLELSKFNDLLATKDGGLALYPDFPVAGLYDVLVAESSDLVQGNVTPQQAVDKIKAAYDQGAPTK